MAEKSLKRIDWLLVCFVVPIIAAGLVTMKSFTPLEVTGNFFNKQIVWILISFAVFFIFCECFCLFGALALRFEVISTVSNRLR